MRYQIIWPSIVILTLLSLVDATNNACTQGLYKLLSPLSTYQPAQAFCSAKFPITPVTTTVVGRKPGKRRVITTSSSQSTSRTNVGTTRSPQDQHSLLLSSLAVQARNVVSTLCGCIGTTKTVTVCGSRSNHCISNSNRSQPHRAPSPQPNNQRQELLPQVQSQQQQARVLQLKLPPHHRSLFHHQQKALLQPFFQARQAAQLLLRPPPPRIKVAPQRQPPLLRNLLHRAQLQD